MPRTPLRTPEVLPPPDPRLQRLRRLARLLDDAFEIPGTGWRIGLDPIVGLVPGMGDLLGGAAGIYALVIAWRLGAPPSVLVRMAANLGLDVVAGAVPFAGDLFDAAWKPNARNVRIVERWLAEPARTRRASRLFMAALLAIVAAAAVGTFVVAWAIVKWAAGVIAA